MRTAIGIVAAFVMGWLIALAIMAPSYLLRARPQTSVRETAKESDVSLKKYANIKYGCIVTIDTDFDACRSNEDTVVLEVPQDSKKQK